MSSFSFNFEANADEDFFGNLRSNSSKLQQLFDGDTLPEAEKQQSLKYQRPKAIDSKQSPKNETCTLVAKVATAFRQQQLQGKLGVALVKSAGDCLQIVLYKSKEHLLATLQLDNKKQNLFKQERYWQFYDDITNMDWSYCFDNLADDEQFKDILQQNGQTFYESVEEGKDTNLNLTAYTKGFPSQTAHDGDSIDLCKPLSLDQAKDSCKPSLLQRMTKIGQPLPNMSKNSMPPTAEISDSSDMEVVTTSPPVQSKPSIAPRNNKFTTCKPMVPSSTITLNATPIFSTISNNLESQHLQMLLTEQRTQGSELRMNVNKLESKIEKILDKLDNLECGCEGNAKEKKHKDDEILELEEKILNLKKENRKLKQVIEESDSRKAFDINATEIIKRCQEDLHKFNIRESTNVERVIKHCIESLHDEKETIEKQRKIIEDMEKREKNIDNFLDNRKLLEKQLLDEKYKVDLLKSDTEEKIKLIKSQQQQIQGLQKDLLAKSNENEQPVVDVVVKAIMNNLYADISSNLTPSVCGDMAMVLSVVETVIRQKTLKALKELLPEEK